MKGTRENKRTLTTQRLNDQRSFITAERWFFAVYASITISNAKVSKFLISPDSISDKPLRSFFYRFHKQDRRGKLAYLARFIPALTSPGFSVFYSVDLYIQKCSIAAGNLLCICCITLLCIGAGMILCEMRSSSEQVYNTAGTHAFECFQYKYQQKYSFLYRRLGGRVVKALDC